MGVRDRYNEKKKIEVQKSPAPSTTTTSGGVAERYKLKKYYQTLDIDSVNNEYIDSFISDTNNFFKGVEDTYKGVDWYNASSVYDSTNNNLKGLKTRGDTIKAWLQKNKDRISEEDYTNLSKSIDDIFGSFDSVSAEFGKVKEAYSKFETEDDYKKYLAGVQRQTELKNYDLTAGAEEIANLEAQLSSKEEKEKRMNDAYKRYLDALVWNHGQAQNLYNFYTSLKSEVAFYDGIEEELAQKRAYYGEAERLQSGIKLSDDAKNAEDFDYYAQIGVDKVKGTGFHHVEVLHDIVSENTNNIIIHFRENPDLWESVLRQDASNNRKANKALKYAQYMSDEEYAIFTYYCGKDEALAERYLESLEETINGREAGEIVDFIGDNGFLKVAFGFAAGVEQFGSGVTNLFSNEDYYVPSASQMASAEIRDSFDTGFGRVAYDLANTTGNMLPSILVGTVTGGIGGNITMGLSAMGNAKAEMINLGYTKDQATTYGFLVGASEALLQGIAGGISKLSFGNSVSDILTTKVLTKVDNAFARISIKHGKNFLHALSRIGAKTAIKMGSEALEESLQTILEPWFKSIVTGVDFEAPDVGDVLYSGLLGALSAGLLEGAGTIGGEVSTYKTGKLVQNVGTVDRLTKLGSTFAADSVAYKIAKKVNKNTGAYTIGRLLNEVDATLTEQNKSEIRKSLKRKGMLDADIETHIKWLNEVVEGATITDEQALILNSNEIVSKTFNDVIINQNSTVNQRSKAYSQTADIINKGVIDKKASNGSQTAETSTVETSSTPTPSEGSTAPNTSETKADDNGSVAPQAKTTYDGNEVNIKEVSAVKDGEVFVRLDDGRKVSTKYVNFDKEEDGLVYEHVANMNPATAQYFIDGFNKGKVGEGKTISLETYIRGFDEAYKIGSLGVPYYSISKDGMAALLSETQRKIAYNRGRIDSVAKVEAQQKALDEKRATVSKTENVEKKKGKVTFDKGVYAKNNRQKTSVKALQVLSDALGINIHIFESSVGEDGKRIGENGRYDPSTNTIYIDLYAGADGKSTILFTAAHELTHFIRDWSPQKFKTFADFLIEQYGAHGVSVDQLVQRQIAKAKRNGRDIDFDTAYEEVVADACETMLTDSNALKKLAMLKAKDRGLVNKIKTFINNLVERIKKAYARLEPDSVEANLVRGMVDVAEQLQSLWTDALMDAGEAYQAVGSKDSSTVGETKHSDRDSNGLELIKKYPHLDLNKDISKMDGVPAIQLVDGSVLPFTETHVSFIKTNKIDVEDIESGGWITDGIYESTARSDTLRFKEQQLAKRRMEEKRKAKIDVKYSDRDSEGNPLSKEQQEFFKDSKVRDENGNLLEVYHGTFEKFSIFDISKTSSVNALGKGHYFTTSLKDATEHYAKAGGYGDNSNDTDAKIESMAYDLFYERGYYYEDSLEGDSEINEILDECFREAEEYYSEKNATLMSVYLNIKNPLFVKKGSEVGSILSRVFVDINNKIVDIDESEILGSEYDGIIDTTVSETFQGVPEGTMHIVAFNSNQIKLTNNETPTDNPDIRYSFRGTNKDGIEVYETSEEIKKLSYEERQKTFLDIMQKQYRGRTAKFIRNGHAYYARFETADVNKNIYGDNKSDSKGWKAKINVGADGNIFELVENSHYDGSKQEKGKKITAHKNVGHWDYFIKTVQIDDRVFDLLANVRKKGEDGYVYSIQLKENKKVEASPSLGLLLKASNRMLNASTDDTISQNPDSVKLNFKNSQKFSERDPQLAEQREKINKVLASENAKLKEDNQYLKELVKLQRKQTHGTKFTKSSVQIVASKLMKYARANGNRAELVQLLNNFYEHIANGENLAWEEIAETAQPAVDWLKQHVVNQKTKLDPHAREILDNLRSKRIYLNKDQQSEAAYVYGSFYEYRKKAMGSLMIVNKDNPNGAIALESVWYELAELYPDYFDSEVTVAEMPARLLDIIDALRNFHDYSTDYEYADDMVEQDLLLQVYDSYWDVSTLHTAADSYQKDINLLKIKHHKKITELRDYHSEKHNQLKKDYQEKITRIKSEYRERNAKNTRELMNRYQESRAKATEGRHKTELKHKIQKVVKELKKLLLSPTKDKHVKEELQRAVAEALWSINMDTVGADERVAKYNDLIAKSSDPDVIQELTDTRDRIQFQGENLKDKLDALKSAYEKIKNSKDAELSNAYQEVVLNSISNTLELVGDTPIRYMSLEQLEAVYEMYSMVLHTVRTANKMFKESKYETLVQTAEAVNSEVRLAGGEHYKRTALGSTLNKIGWTFLKPFTAFRTIGSKTLTSLYNNLRSGEDTYYVDIKEAQDFIQEQYKKHNFSKWDMKQTKEFTAKSGKTFSLTLEQMMSIFAYSRREQAKAHLLEGGIVLDDAVKVVEKNKLGLPVKYEVTTKSAFNLSEGTLLEIIDSLTDEQKAFVKEMQNYLSDTMGAKGNEISMEMYGIKLFKEAFYFPIKSSSDYMGFKPEEAGEIKLKNPSFSKETVRHANNPVVLSNFTDVWADHVNDMSMYHSFVLPLEDFTRVFNYKSRTDAMVETMSTEATIANAYGKGATQYIRNFLKSLNGGVRIQGTPVDKLISLTKKGAVLASASVVIQQPSAVMRAMAYIKPKYFVKATPDSLKLVNHKKDWAEIKQYAPIAGIKEMGHFDIGLGQSTVDWIKSNKTTMEKVDDALSKAPAYMDEVTWISIWQAVKREVLDTTDLKYGTEAYLNKVGERFTEIVSLSQVYDSVFARSDIMRNPNPLAKMLTSFMAEPSTTLNMLFDSWVQGKRTGSKKAIITTSSAVVSSIVLNAMLKSLVIAMRDDDEDESYIEKYFEAFSGDLKDNLNPLTLIPVVKDVVSIFKGYDVERMDMALFSDLKNAIDAFDSDSKTEYEKWSGLVGAISAFFGVPIKNVERDVRGFINTMISFFNGEKTTGAGIWNSIQEGWIGKDISKTNQLYEAYLNDDQEQIKRVEGRFKDQSDIDAALRKALRENDPRIREAAQAVIDGNHAERIRITKEIKAEGHFKQDIIVAAINAELNAMRRELKEAENKK